MKKNNETKYLNHKTPRKVVVAWSMGVSLAVATAVTVPLVIVLTKETKVQPPINGTYYSLFGDNNRFATLEEAQAYLQSKSTKPQVFKFNGEEYSTNAALNAAIDAEAAEWLATTGSTKIHEEVFNYTGTGFTSYDQLTNNVRITSSWTKSDGANGHVGYIFGEGAQKNVYYSLEEAQQAWLKTMTEPKVAGSPEVVGSAEVITSNVNYSGKFTIDLPTATSSQVSEIISKLSWVAGTDITIPADASLALVSFADTGTDAHFLDDQGQPMAQQQISFLTDYSLTAPGQEGFTITQTKAPVPASSTLVPLSTKILDTYSTPGIDFQFTKAGQENKFLNKIFPHYEGTTFIQGNCSKADLATWFDTMINELSDNHNLTSVTNDGGEMVTFLMNGIHYMIDTSTVTMPTDWQTVDLMDNTQDTALSKETKYQLVLAMAKQEMITVNNQSTMQAVSAVPGEYALTTPSSNVETSKVFNIVGPSDGSSLTLDSFVYGITGGQPEEVHKVFDLQYDGTSTGISQNVGVNGTTPSLPTANDLSVNIIKNYAPEVIEVPFTINDAPAIETDTFNELVMQSTPQSFSNMTQYTGNFNGYVYTDRNHNDFFFKTLYDAQQELLRAEHPRPTNIRLEDTSTTQVIVNGVTYPDIQHAYDALIYHVDWIGTPETPVSNPSRKIEDLYII